MPALPGCAPRIFALPSRHDLHYFRASQRDMNAPQKMWRNLPRLRCSGNAPVGKQRNLGRLRYSRHRFSSFQGVATRHVELLGKSLGTHRFQHAVSAENLLIGIHLPQTGDLEPASLNWRRCLRMSGSFKFVSRRDCTLEAMRTQGSDFHPLRASHHDIKAPRKISDKLQCRFPSLTGSSLPDRISTLLSVRVVEMALCSAAIALL